MNDTGISRPKTGQEKSTTRQVLDLLKGSAVELFIDILVFGNIVIVALEVDDTTGENQGLFDAAKMAFCVIYILEYAFRFIAMPKTVRKVYALIEALIVLVAVVGVFALTDIVLLWRISVFRVIRYLRIAGYGHVSPRLADLWLVIVGVAKGMKALSWLGLILFTSVLAGGAMARGFIFSGGDNDDLNTAVCGGDNFRTHMTCLDYDEYFGSVPVSSMSMLQIATLDRWASNIVRPMLYDRPMAAVMIMGFVMLCTYGLLSMAVGVLVWSTVELARSHSGHRDRMNQVQDKLLVRSIRDYFEASLAMEERDMMDLRELRDGMCIPAVKQAWKDLDLPIKDLKQLWEHLDPLGKGEISLDDFEDGCNRLQQPATRFDMACLSARLGGRAVFAETLADRVDATVDDMTALMDKLDFGFQKMREYTASEDVHIFLPEAGLRRAGFMYIPHPELADDDF